MKRQNCLKAVPPFVDIIMFPRIYEQLNKSMKNERKVIDYVSKCRENDL